MPSLSAKSESVAPTDPVEFSKNMVVMMEKKIRNLEKRKSKLEDYRAKEKSGQTLTAEQLKAVSKLDDVLSQIELLQELIKQTSTYGAEVVKQQKRQQKRERFEQIESERKRFAEVLHLQSVLNALGTPETREAFVTGTEGAVKLEEQELNHLDELYKIINPERGNDCSLTDQLKSSAEHLQSLLDAREKAIFGTTYRQLNDLLTKIKDCSFFTETAKSPVRAEESSADVNETSTEKDYVLVKSEEVPHADSAEVLSSLPPEVLPEQPAVTEPEQQIYQTQNIAAIQQPVIPDPTKTFEEIVENVQGRFNFIQESELDVDSPSHVDPAVVAVHQMPTAQHYQSTQPMVNHSQPNTENSSFSQQSNTYQQYHMQSASASAPTEYVPAESTPQPIPMPNENPGQTSGQSMFSQNPQTDADQHHFDNGFDGAAQKHDNPSNDDYQHRGQGQMRRGGRGGGYRGGDRSGNQNMGYSNRRGGGYRGDNSGYRGGDKSGSGNDRGGRRDTPSGNGFQSDNRRGGRGGSGQRGSSGGFRGGNSSSFGGNRRPYRGGHGHQQQPVGGAPQ